MATQLINEVGNFRCKVETPKYGWFDETSKGSKFIRIPCVCSQPESKQHGKIIYWQGYLTSNAIDKTEQTLVKVFGDDWTWANINFVGKDVDVVVEEEEYNGKKQFKARWINPPGENKPTRDASEAKALSDKIAASLPPRSASPALDNLEEEENIPF